MKLVDRKTFMGLPSGTIFAERDENIMPWFRWFYKKWNSIADLDYTEYSILDEIWFPFATWGEDNMTIMYERLEKWESVYLEECYWRNGMYDKEQRYIIYEERDIRHMVDTISELYIVNKE